MDPSLVFKKYLLYSLSFHAILLILFFLFPNQTSVQPQVALKVTMIRLTQTPPSAPIVPVPVEPIAKEAPPVEVKKETAPPSPSEKKPLQAKPAPLKPQKELTKIIPIGPEKAPAKKVPSPDEQKIAEALSEVKSEIQEREVQEKTASLSPGPSGAPGGPGYGSPHGEITAQDPGIAQYRGQVRSKIIRQWIRTSSSAEDKILRARVLVRINASGAVISKSLTKSSGDGAFDNSALRAVERASPFPPPPEGVKGEALGEGFIVDFSSRVLGRK